MTKYAKDTNVSVEKSKAEIEKILQKYGADQFMSGWDEKQAFILFTMRERNIKFLLPLPDKNDTEFMLTPGKKKERSPQAALKAWEQACRQRWRALGLVIKAKLEATETGITTFDNEFMANIVLPGGKTASEHMMPQIVEAYKTGKVQKLIPFLSSEKEV